MPFPGTVSIPIQFTGGLNSKIAEFTLDQPNLTKAVNVRYNQFGQLDKRAGFGTLSTDINGGGNISKGYQLTTYNEELLLLDGTNLYSYQDEEEVWINRGTAFATTNDQVRILNTKIATQKNPDATSSNNISIYAWEDDRTKPTNTNGVRYSVINNDTQTLIVSDKLVFIGATHPKTITDGTNFYILYNASQFSILYNTIPVNRPNTITAQYTSICSDGQPTIPNTQYIPYDAVIYNGNILVAYASTTGVNLGGTIISPNTDVQTIGMCVDSNNNIWIAFSDTTNTYITCWTALANIFVAVLLPVVLTRFSTLPAVNLALIEDNNAGSCNITAEVAGANGNYINNFIVSPTIGEITFIGQIRSVGLASKPFRNGDNIFINTIYSSNLQSTYFTQCLTQGTGFESGTTNVQGNINSTIATSFAIVAKHSPQNGGTYRTNGILSQADSIGDNEYLFAGQRKGPFTSFQNAETVNLGVAGYTIQFNSTDSFNNVSSNNNLHLVGGVKKIYDGISCVEDNFHVFPENSDGYGCSITLTSGGNLTYNPLTVPNQYQYVVVYEWTDNYGQVQRSGVSVANTIVTTATGQGTILTGPTLRLTEKISPRSPVCISIYRTQDTLPIFYKITNDNNPLVNDTTVDTWTFTDIQSDMQIGANENLYTGSQLSNTAPPACSLISLYQQRLFINSTEDKNVLWYSQNKFEQDQYNTLPLDWNTSFVEGVDSRAGNGITAIGLIDNNLAIFKETSIFILQGDGPNALLTNGQFNDAQLIVSDTGCINQNSLCFITQTPKLPGGLLFKSPKGIYLFGRDQSLYYIGAPVEKYNYLTITSANLLSKTNEVVFTSLEGICLVYNYFFDAWTTWENLPAIEATVWKDQLCILAPNGSVMVQDITGTVWSDTFVNKLVSPVQLTLTFPWIKFAGQGNLQGRAAVYNCVILGTLQGNHILQSTVAWDYNPSILQTSFVNSTVAGNRWGSLPIWGNNGMWGNNQFSNYQFQLNFRYPRGSTGGGVESLQITLSDINPDATQGFSLNGLVFEVMGIAGNFIVPTGHLVGASGAS